VEAVRLKYGFWAPRLETLRRVMLPAQHRLLEETGRIDNFRRASERTGGDYSGHYFNDSDVYKWLEAVGFSLASAGDEGLRGLAEDVIGEVAAAQDEDGYLDTYFTLERKGERWTNLRDLHELYCAGHLIQAAIAYNRSTGDTALLDVATSLADHIAGVFGPGRRPGTPGHPEIEMALVELHRLTGRAEYLELARFFLDQRGRGVIGGRDYHIDRAPFKELDEIVGHAVRSVYLNCGATDVYLETGEKALWDTLERLWRSMTGRRMYVTGGVGARHQGEAFGADYELPSEQAYAETCAAIASAMWGWRMLLVSGEARYADIMELAFYNGFLSGPSLDGESYFYVNPLADRGGHRRQPWFPCACCPPNIARTLASLPGYFYSVSPGGLWVHLYAEGTAHVDLDGSTLKVAQRTEYPWEGHIRLLLEPETEAPFTLRLRIPGWCREAELLVNEEDAEVTAEPGSYVEVERMWRSGDEVELSLAMPVERALSNPLILENTDRVALRRGPLIYCLEAVYNPGVDVWSIVLPAGTELEAEYSPDLLNGVVVIRGDAFVVDADFGEDLYSSSGNVPSDERRVPFMAIPYHAWANREPGPMIVWIRSRQTDRGFRRYAIGSHLGILLDRSEPARASALSRGHL
jgi:DUF1680 family protein